MFPTGTDNKKVARRRAVALAIGLGALAVMPFTVHAVTTPGLAPGEALPKTGEIPPSVKKALKSNGPVVVAFVLPGINDDTLVRERLISLRKEPRFKSTKILIFRVTPQSKLGDLPDILGITTTPAVAVFQSDDKLFATWRGIVDEDMIAQSIQDARDAVPHVLPLHPWKGPAKGDKAGIALARKVNAAYGKTKGVSTSYSHRLRRPVDHLTGIVTGEEQILLRKGRVVRLGFSGTDADGVARQAVINRTGVFIKRDTQTCWVHLEPELGQVINQKMIPVAGYRFGKPKKAKNGLLVLTTRPIGSKVKYTEVYRIDPKTSQIVSWRSGTGLETTSTMKLKSLTAAPAIPKPDTLC